MSKLDLKFLPKDHGLLINNEIGGISVRFVKSQPHSDFGEATHLQLETDVSDIHVCFNVFIRLYKFFNLDLNHTVVVCFSSF